MIGGENMDAYRKFLIDVAREMDNDLSRRQARDCFTAICIYARIEPDTELADCILSEMYSATSKDVFPNYNLFEEFMYFDLV